MRGIVRAATVAGACGLVLSGTGAGSAEAQTQTNPGSLLSAVAGADLGTVAETVSGVVCNNRLADFHYQSPVSRSPHPCINGPVQSGNSENSNNFINHGNPVDSGNIETAAGSTNSLNEVKGAQSNSGNDISRAQQVFP
ncbi:hypothetical protein [Streptomyces abikoensis]|uniref:hypothetical protein n=1 Tax=Streptomyces abikoensis TaxID=97398 RepID=UPI0019A110AD|nr:hypothetical protein [Streptomyces abikoensis]GGP62738.1 hypothetical protein GCM10010214_40560 [Streptomyces abikoensis]